jgi:RNA polymerase sigma-70 factor (ECF subfamily)
MMMTTDFDAVRGFERVRMINASPSVADDGPPDDALIQRLRDGDATAGDMLVSRYSVRLMRYLRRLSGSDHIAEELFQQTWLSVLNHLDRFHAGAAAAAGGASVASGPGDSSGGHGGDDQVKPGTTASAAAGGPIMSGGFKAWLFRIATNKANDAWRARSRESAATAGIGHMCDGEVAPHAGQSLEQAEQEAKLKRAIDQLPDSQRQVLLLRFYSGLKFIEIADVLGCPLNTALGRLHKAILKLRVLMQ